MRPDRGHAGTGFAEAEFPLMGGTGHVIVLGQDAGRLLAHARGRLDELEATWSRFRPDSDVGRLNRAGGASVDVSPDTVTLLRHSVSAWELTDGHFDPTVHAAMVAHGYDRDLVLVGRPAGPAPGERLAAPGCAGVEVDPDRCRVRLPAGVGIDPGGIGKGLAADLVCAELLRAGASGALVNVGGDLRAAGRPPEPSGWVVAVADPHDADLDLVRVALDGGGVATSSTLRRRWTAGGRDTHHVLDPRTGVPTAGAVVAVTVVAATAAWAEALTKAILVAGDPAAVPTGLLRDGPHSAGPHSAGPHSAGPHSAGPHSENTAAEYVAVTRDGRRLASLGLHGLGLVKPVCP